jgi:hypothetical protein
MREFFTSTKVVNAVPAKTSVGNETINGTDIDRAGFESVLFAINIGAKTDGTVVPQVEESDTGGGAGYTAVADADLIGLESDASVADAAAGANEVRKLAYKGYKRFVRLVLTVASNAGSAPVAAVAILGHARHAPNQNAAGAAVTQVP